MHLRIASAANVLGLVLGLGIALLIAISLLALNQLKVGGPIYQRIVSGKDLIADVLPPPEYVIEAYLEATLALGDPASVAMHQQRLLQLHKEYDDRRAYWEKQSFNDELQDKLTKASNAKASIFWSEIESIFLPALSKGDLEVARKSYGEITMAYGAHRKIIDEIVVGGSTLNAQIESEAARNDKMYTMLFWGVAVIVLLVAGGAIYGLIVGIVRPISTVTKVMNAVAAGDPVMEIPLTRRSDEIGSMTSSLIKLRDSLAEKRRLAADLSYTQTIGRLGYIKDRTAIQQEIDDPTEIWRDSLDYSQEAEAISGLTAALRSDLTDELFLERHVHPDDRSRVRDVYGAEQGSYSIDYRYLHPDGREIEINESRNIRMDPVDGSRHYYWVIQDITERKRRERDLIQIRRQLEQAEERANNELQRFRDLLNAAQQAAHFGYWTYDYALAEDDPNAKWGPEFYYSPENSTISGLSAEKIASMSAVDMAEDYVRAEDRRKFIDNMTAFSSGRVDRYQMEYMWHHPDGHMITVCSTGVRHRGPNGEPLQATGIVQDLTERHAIQRAIREQADALKKAEIDLIYAQKFEALGVLASGIAHDFHNVLAGINGFAELAMLEGDDREKLEIFLGKIKTCVGLGKGTIARIMAFSRASNADKVLLDMREAVNNATVILQHALPAAVDIRTDLGSDRLSILGDATQIEQAIMNLCNNAAQAMRGGGTIRVRLSCQSLFGPGGAGQNSTRKYARLTIADTGSGIPDEIKARIFDPFFSTKAVGKGTGLGLSIVRKVVSDQGGSIRVRSKIGKGTVFRILLPLVDAAASLSSTQDHDNASGLVYGKGERILLVEDDVELSEATSRLMAFLNYEVTTTNSSLKALELVRRDPARFDLMVTDLKMPKMTGAELIVRIAELRADLPVIVATGYDSGLLEQAAHAGAVKYILMKPVEHRRLALAISRVLQMSGQVQDAMVMNTQ